MTDNIDKIKERMLLLPDQSQIAIGVVKVGAITYEGFFKNEKGISEIDNANVGFEIGSVAKVFTANLLAKMIIEGEIQLEDPIEKFLSFSLKGGPPITIKHLVGHTSGLPRLPNDFFSYPGYLENNPYLKYDEKRLIAYLSHSLELENIPGKVFSYSNLGYCVLGYVLSRKAGMRFHNLVGAHILSPLGMMNSGFNRENIRTTMIKGRDSKGNVTSYWDGGIFSGCVGMVSTISDLSKFAVKMLKTEDKVNRIQLQELAAIRPGVTMCMGWAATVNEPNIYWHGGGTAGFGCLLTFSREQQSASIILSNIEPGTFKELIEPLAWKLSSDSGGIAPL